MKRLQFKIALIIWVFIPGQALLSQVSKDNYTGNWETSTSWDPVWPEPKTEIAGPGVTVTIYGYITRNGSLEFYGPTTNLIINDTLVIKGDLTLGNNNLLTVNDGGILIIRGNLSFHDNSIIASGDSYIVVTGNIIKTGEENLGSFTSSGDPVKLFIGGSVPPQLDDNPDYPVLNCSDPPTTAYNDSGCSYGNMADLEDDPMFDLFQSTCSMVIIASNNPVCAGNAIEINVTATDAISYQWTGPDGFTSGSPNLYIPAAGTDMTGLYNLTVTAASLCIVRTSTMITVNPVPDVIITDPAPECSPALVDLTSPAVTAGSTPGVEFTYWHNEEATSALNLPGSATTGNYFIKGTTAEGCFQIKPVTVTINPSPVLVINDPAPVCSPATIDLTSPAITLGSTSGLILSYYTDPEGTTGHATPGTATSGTWYIKGTTAEECYTIKPVTVTIHDLPAVNITSSPGSMCVNDQRILTGYPGGGTFIIIGGPGDITGNTLRATGAGSIELEYHYTATCSNFALQTILVNDYPLPYAGRDQELAFRFNTQMQATLSPFETGIWSLISGSGQIQDIYSPSTIVNNLSTGKNIFRWTVQNGSCEASNEISIFVSDLFIPSVITPNGDGKNDFFVIAETEGTVELIILNRWGLEEYHNRYYGNNWDGRNNNGVSLPNDTYFYILKFENGLTRNGTVLIYR